MDKKLLDVMHTSFQAVADEYEANPDIIFSSDSERKKEYYSRLNNKIKEWNKSSTCIFRGCSNRTVRHSHTIQKEGALRNIADAGKILTPEFDQNENTIRLVSKGLTQASVFPGFCPQHEQLFQKFEKTKKLGSTEAISLQIYRSLCREVIRLKYDIEFLTKDIEDYEQHRNERLMKVLEDRLGREWLTLNFVSIHGINLPNDPLLINAKKRISQAGDLVKELEVDHLTELENEIEGKTSDELKPVIINIDIKIPVALSGVGSFYIREQTLTKRIVAVLGVFPNNGTTDILIHGKVSDTKYIHGYISKLNSSFDLLNMIESWMIRGTDHWFLSPAVWNAKTPKRKREILAEILDEKLGIDAPVPYSIFDDIRSQMVGIANKSEDLLWMKMAKKEEAKIH